MLKRTSKDPWCRAQDRAFVWTGILLSSFVGLIGGLFVGIGSKSLAYGGMAWFGLTLLCLHLTFWRAGQ